ncbi:MAG: biotin--[acetyl-CoA-carboxylase] ligase [Dehalococcoidia bacterium]|nr:biotin--[acetyl-CoA-carboxylase] ligase [Dehalococcoidia bacterium]MSQ17375.1 biotin--[acetyl-CoA-carboxylase] ligase [Dehalococcoidia bacterium]
MPANLVSATLRSGIYTRLVGRRVRYFHELTSTMDEAARLAQEGTPEGAVVVAETQTASRGRFGRTWVSQPGNLYLSVVFRPSMQALPLLPCLGAVAVARAIRQATALNPRLKWPNDVTLGGKKVAGVLVESAIQDGQAGYAVLGIGINVSLDVPKSPPSPLYERGEGDDTTPPGLPLLRGGISQATSLNAQSGREVPRDVLLRHLLHALDRLYLALGRGESPLAEWRALLDTLGQRVRVSPANGDAGAHAATLSGMVEGVDDLGNLLLRQDNGDLVTLTAGDVTLAQSFQLSAISGQLPSSTRCGGD